MTDQSSNRDFSDPRMNLSEGLAAIPAGDNDEPSYLGNISLVESVFRVFASNILTRQQKVADGERTSKQANEVDFVQAYAVAAMFLGKNKDYAPVPGWNVDSLNTGVAAFVSDFYGIDDADTAEEAMVAAMGVFIQSIYQGCQQAADGAPLDVWQSTVDGSIEAFRDLMIGMRPDL